MGGSVYVKHKSKQTHTQGNTHTHRCFRSIFAALSFAAVAAAAVAVASAPVTTLPLLLLLLFTATLPGLKTPLPRPTPAPFAPRCPPLQSPPKPPPPSAEAFRATAAAPRSDVGARYALLLVFVGAGFPVVAAAGGGVGLVASAFAAAAAAAGEAVGGGAWKNGHALPLVHSPLA